MYIYILAFRFYEFFFFRGMKSKLFTNPASLSKSVKNIRIFRSKGESTCVYFFFPPIFQWGNLKGKDIFLPLTLVFGTLVWSKDCFSGDSGSLFQSLPHLFAGDIKVKNKLE